MSLRTLLPGLANDVHAALAAADISTAQDILFVQPAQLYSRLPKGLLSLRELADLKAQVAQLVSAPAARGDALFIREAARESAREPCVCGVDELDALLGGFGLHAVIEIAGGKRSGKTGLVLQVVLRHLARHPDHTAFWLDVGGEFTIERAADILQLNPGIGAETALDRLTISSCFDVAEAHQALENLRVSLVTGTDASHTRFIVIDPLTPLFAPILSATSSQGHAVMTTFMRLLSSLAHTYALTALVTNSAVQAHKHNPYSAFERTTTKPALGPSFTFLTDETLWLANADAMVGPQAGHAHVFIAEVFRSHSTVSKTWCAFVIRSGVSFEPFQKPFPMPSSSS